jgi:transposase
MVKKGDEKTTVLQEHGVLNPNPENVRDELFQNSDFFDSRDLVQVKYEMLRRVFKDNYPVARASGLFGFSRPTFYQLQKAFHEKGLPGLLPQQRGPRAPYKLNEEVMDFVEQILGRNSSLKTGRLVELIEDRFGFKVHPRSIERALKRRKKNDRNSPCV